MTEQQILELIKNRTNAYLKEEGIEVYAPEHDIFISGVEIHTHMAGEYRPRTEYTPAEFPYKEIKDIEMKDAVIEIHSDYDSYSFRVTEMPEVEKEIRNLIHEIYE
jgi:hypothetical protein